MNERIEMYIMMLGSIFFMLNIMIVVALYFTGHEDVIQNYIKIFKYTCIALMSIAFFKTKKPNYLLGIFLTLMTPYFINTMKLLSNTVK